MQVPGVDVLLKCNVFFFCLLGELLSGFAEGGVICGCKYVYTST